jgi:hypothetical protein
VGARAIRRRLKELVSALDIPTPFDADELCKRIAAVRGRPLELRAIVMPVEAPGLLVSAAGRFWIFFERYTTELHQEQVKLHEAGHLFLAHEATDVLDPETSRLLLPNLDPATVQHMLQRTCYTRRQERDAETVASLILEQANRWRPESEWTAPPGTAGMRMRISQALEHPTERGMDS